MEDFEQNQNYEMIKERMKERPINRKKLMRRTMITVSMAVIFGVFACITFLVLEPVISNLLYPEPAPEVVGMAIKGGIGQCTFNKPCSCTTLFFG